MSTGIFGALGRNRTCDQEIRRLLLYPLSYEGGVGFEAVSSLQALVKKGFILDENQSKSMRK
jgi:hypothetical protein|tara:strand:- start:127 stop:312 length:186 start_codon:yes stop_codon:yes gene_type:complete